MAQAVSRRPLTAEAWVRFRLGPCGICGGQSGTGTGFSPSTSVFPLSISFYRCYITWKHEKKKLIIFLFVFMPRLQNKPQGCGASVASATGPFNKKILLLNLYDVGVDRKGLFRYYAEFKVGAYRGLALAAQICTSLGPV
jgi:hypothetical protein